MDEKLLFKISIITAIAGIVLLYLVSGNRELAISEVEQEDYSLNNKIWIEGQVTDVKEVGNNIIMSVNYEQRTSIIAFKAKNLSITPGDNLRIEGEARMYNGKKEIIADKIRFLKNG